MKTVKLDEHPAWLTVPLVNHQNSSDSFQKQVNVVYRDLASSQIQMSREDIKVWNDNLIELYTA